MIKVATAAEQVASHLKNELLQGRWTKTMPGRDRLSRELGLDGSTIERALHHLEKEGVLQSQGAGKRRLITLDAKKTSGKRILFVPYETDDQYGDYLIMELRHQLHAAGHSTTFTPKSLVDVKHDPQKVAALMKASPHEACILVAGSRPVLEIAAKAPKPCFGLFGRMKGLAMAGTGPQKTSALRDAVDCLYRHGHRRIVMLTQAETLQQGLGATQLAFLEELEQQGLSASDYNLPKWDSTAAGLRKCLESLFQVTPPTAILVDDWMLLYAIQNFLARMRGPEYRKVACISTDHHPSFKWCDPRVSYIRWDTSAVCRRVMQWVDHVAQGKRDLNQRPIQAKFIEGEELALL